MRAWRTRRGANEAGISLVEVLVSTLIFGIIVSIITASIVAMLRQERTQNSQTTNLDAARSVITKLDHQARYANAVSTPGTGTDGSYYVEFQTGNTSQQQTCTQWRYVPVGGTVQYRTWQPPLGGSGSSTASAWSTVGTGFSLIPSTPATQIWTLGPTVTGPLASSSTAYSTDSHYQLLVDFDASNGTPKETAQSQVAITAINSTRNAASPTPPAVCTQNGRP
ncbi:MAG TPA: prepilin-type N-terminal cleavage/methylation domain-containing protein [Mycobacteriales bacterium]|nr:prepilin-type N-terminal cleavage/methylation domain-containing protein [Mycobacteriales bacterium]